MASSVIQLLKIFVILWACYQSTGLSTLLEDIKTSPTAVANVRGRPRSEIDLTTEKQVLVCAGQNKSLECVSPGSSISIMDTFWGRLTDKLCPSEDGDPSINCASDQSTTYLVKGLCDNKVFCQIPARHTVLQNPGTLHCPGVNKYLIVNYTCIPDERKFVLCNGETTKLLCGQEWKLNVLSAFWGRTSILTCPTPLGQPSRFGTCDNFNSSIDILRMSCQGKEECVVRADDMHMAQGRLHCPDVEKYAMISYRCQPNVQQVVGQFPQETSDTMNTINTTPKRVPQENQHAASSPQNTTNTQGTQPTQEPLDSLLHEYMQNQARHNEDVTSSSRLPVPQDSQVSPNTEKLPVPQDNSNVAMQQHIAMLKNILRSKNLMRVGNDVLIGMNKATGDRFLNLGTPTPGIHSNSKPTTTGVNSMPGSEKEQHRQGNTDMKIHELAQSSDAIKLLSRYSHKSEDEIKTLFRQFKPGSQEQGNPGKIEQGNPQPALGSSHTINSFPQTTNSNVIPTQVNKMVGNVPTSIQVSKARDTHIENNTNLDTHFSDATPTTKIVTSQTTPSVTNTTSSTVTVNTVTSKGKETTTKPTEHVSVKHMHDPTASLGGKVMGNTFYEKYLKPAMNSESKAKNGAINEERKGQDVIKTLSKKVSALQAISDALTLLTSKLNPDRRGGKRHHYHRHHDLTSELSASVGQEDIDFIQKKINKAIEMAETMGRHEIYRNPHLVALNLAGKVSSEVLGRPRNEVEQGKAQLSIDKQITDIEDSVNKYIESAEVTGKLDGVNKKSKPTPSLFGQQKSGPYEVSFSSGNKTNIVQNAVQEDTTNLTHETNATKPGTVVESLPRIILSNKSIETSFSEQQDPQLGMNNVDKVEKRPRAVDVASKNVSIAANSIVKALRRQTGIEQSKHFIGKNFTIALQPVTTFNNLNEVTLGGRINNEVVKEKENEKLYMGKDVNLLLNMMKGKPTVKSPLPSSTNNVNSVKEGSRKLDESTMAIMEKVVKNLLKQKQQLLKEKEARAGSSSQTYRKKKGHKSKSHDTEEEDDADTVDDDDGGFTFGTKHYYGSQKVSSQNAGKKDQLDQDLMTQLVNQLDRVQNDNKINGMPNDSQKDDNENGDVVKAVPTDRKVENGFSLNQFLDKPAAEPRPVPSDDPIKEILNSFTGPNSVGNLMLKLQGTSLGNLFDEEPSGPEKAAPKSETAEKNSLKPHVIAFTAEEMSGRIGSSNDGKTSVTKTPPVVHEFAGGQILQPSIIGLKPKSEKTFAVINVKPTTKSEMNEPRNDLSIKESKDHRKLQISNIVKGVRLLLKALMGEKPTGPQNGKTNKEELDNEAHSKNRSKHYPEDNFDFNYMDNANTERFNNHEKASRFHSAEWYYGKDKNEVLGVPSKENTHKHDINEDYDGYFEYRDTKQVPYYQDSRGVDRSEYTPQQLLDYNAGYDENLAKQFSVNPSMYSTFTPNSFDNPYTSYSLQSQSMNYLSPSPRETLASVPTEAHYKFPDKIKHALNKALKNDPVIQAVESFEDNEKRLYDEKLKGVQKHSHIPERRNKQLVKTNSIKAKPVKNPHMHQNRH